MHDKQCVSGTEAEFLEVRDKRVFLKEGSLPLLVAERFSGFLELGLSLTLIQDQRQPFIGR